MADIFEQTLEDKLYRTKYEPDPDTSHITLKSELCRECEGKPCTFVCPAKAYKVDPNDEKAVVVSHENCLECGTCRKLCPHAAVEWRQPDGGVGVKYRFG